MSRKTDERIFIPKHCRLTRDLGNPSYAFFLTCSICLITLIARCESMKHRKLPSILPSGPSVLCLQGFKRGFLLLLVTCFISKPYCAFKRKNHKSPKRLYGITFHTEKGEPGMAASYPGLLLCKLSAGCLHVSCLLKCLLL